MLKFIITFILLISCQKVKPKPSIVQPLVAQKAEVYKSLHKSWAHDKCDSLGFTALCKLSGGCQEADILQAEGEPGRWYRSPEHDCYDLGQSKSDISKDMLLMLFPYLHATGQKQELEQIYQYGKANGNVMGRGYLSRTFMTPPMVILLEKMTGRALLPVPVIATAGDKAGYEKHLDVVYLISKWMVEGGIDSQEVKLLKKYKDESPSNALFQAMYHKFTDGDQSDAIAILLDESLFPESELPTSGDRCEEYLWQRDYSDKDWRPCDKGTTHDGVDYLIAAWLAGQL